MLKPPTEQEIFSFVLATHAMDRINLSYDQVKATWNHQGQPNPYAQGHFRAHMFIVNTLLPSTDFPAKDSKLIQNIQDSELALSWVKTIHRKIVEPLLSSHLVDLEDINAPSSLLVAKYRISHAVSINRPAPPPDAISKIMHNWLLDYTEFHNQIKSKVANPYGIDKTLGKEIVNRAYEANLFFCSVQPMSSCNQRMGRLLENIFRLAWFLPMKIYQPDDDNSRKLAQDIENYQNDKIPLMLKRTSNVRG